MIIPVKKMKLATLIGNFNPGWDSKSSNDEAFFQAVSVAGMILENKFERYLEMNVQTDGWKKFLQNMLLPWLRAIPGRKYQYPYTSGIYSLPKNAFRKLTLLL